MISEVDEFEGVEISAEIRHVLIFPGSSRALLKRKKLTDYEGLIRFSSRRYPL